MVAESSVTTEPATNLSLRRISGIFAGLLYLSQSCSSSDNTCGSGFAGGVSFLERRSGHWDLHHAQRSEGESAMWKTLIMNALESIDLKWKDQSLRGHNDPAAISVDPFSPGNLH